MTPITSPNTTDAASRTGTSDRNVWTVSDGWQDATREHQVTEPATGAQLGTAGLATPEDVHRAATRAAEAQRSWAATPSTCNHVRLRRAAPATDVIDTLIR